MQYLEILQWLISICAYVDISTLLNLDHITTATILIAGKKGDTCLTYFVV